jgi:hypothetical protein
MFAFFFPHRRFHLASNSASVSALRVIIAPQRTHIIVRRLLLAGHPQNGHGLSFGVVFI